MVLSRQQTQRWHVPKLCVCGYRYKMNNKNRRLFIYSYKQYIILKIQEMVEIGESVWTCLYIGYSVVYSDDGYFSPFLIPCCCSWVVKSLVFSVKLFRGGGDEHFCCWSWNHYVLLSSKLCWLVLFLLIALLVLIV